MKIVLPMEGVTRKVLTTPFLHAFETNEGYTLKGETLHLECVEPGRVLILPDDVPLEEGDVLTEALERQALPITSFLTISEEEARSDALGLLLRDAVAREHVTDKELLRIQPALKDRIWKPGIAVVPGDVYSHCDLLYRCVQAHTTQADWPPDFLPALWRRVQPEAAVMIWQVNTDYAADMIVGYPDETTLYACVLGHTSQAGWEPPNTPALWRKQDP